MSNKAYQIRRSARVKRARIIVSADKVEVVAPLGMSNRQVQQFVSAKQDWITSARSKVQQQVANIDSFAPSIYQHGAMIPFQGERYPLNVKAVSDTRLITIEFDRVFIAAVPEYMRKKLTTLELSEKIRSALVGQMGDIAGQQVHKYLRKYQALYQLYARSASIKVQKSRWGSCGIHNDIYLNWLLILAPTAVLEYVVVHEICHIKYRHHSPVFWGLVAKHCPDYQQQRHWLKQHGAGLMLGL